MKSSPTKRLIFKRLKLTSLAVSLLIAVLWRVNLPFYSGSCISSRGSWRLEHGRFTLNWGRPSTESFYIAINPEPLR